jgi:hypothetical protein
MFHADFRKGLARKGFAAKLLTNGAKDPNEADICSFPKGSRTFQNTRFRVFDRYWTLIRQAAM